MFVFVDVGVNVCLFLLFSCVDFSNAKDCWNLCNFRVHYGEQAKIIDENKIVDVFSKVLSRLQILDRVDPFLWGQQVLFLEGLTMMEVCI